MKKKLLVLTMTLAILLVFSFGTALADAILFPYWISGGGYATFIQIINRAEVDTPETATTSGKLHYVFVYNTIPEDDPDAEICQHFDRDGLTTENDILLFEVTKQFFVDDGADPGEEQLLPGDTTSTSPSVLTMAFTLSTRLRFFLRQS